MAKAKRNSQTDEHEDVVRKPKGGFEVTKLRIIGGSMRGRTIPFRVDPTTRPMKDRTREALFNLLGGKLDDFVAVDLFAGSGVLLLESISRGAVGGVGVELDRRAFQDLLKTVELLGVQNARFVQGDAFAVAEVLDSRFSELKEKPWCVFICPPYRLWVENREACQRLLDCVCEKAPAGSLVAVEFDEPAPLEMLSSDWNWDVRTYRPAVLAIGDRR